MPSSKYKVSDQEFIEAVKNSISIAEVLKKIGVTLAGGSYRSFKIRKEALQLDTSHFLGGAYLRGKTHNYNKKIPLSEILIEKSNRVLNSRIKNRIIKAGLLANQCVLCGLDNQWNGQILVLQIDHINGNPFDHRIENLRLLCPNCHSQTNTFCSKNRNGRTNRKRTKEQKLQIIKNVKPKNKCLHCNNECKNYQSKYCEACYRTYRRELQTTYPRKTKIVWPSKEELLEKLSKSNYTQVAKELGISDNAIRKHLKRL